MRIIVVGGGIGGLALGAGLRRAGHEVVVYDRDTDAAATGGYQITLDEQAQTALSGLVGPEVMRRLRASASALCRRERDTLWDRRGRVIGYGPELRDSVSLDVDRITLRLLLAEAVGADLRLGHTVAGLDKDGVRVRFADGTSDSADLIVGADGAHSVVAQELAGARTNQPAGLIGFCGRTRRADLSAGEQERLGLRSSMGVGPHGAALYVGYLDPVGFAVLNEPELRMSVTTGPTYIWGAMFPESSRTAALRDLRGRELQTALAGRFREHHWSEQTLEVIARSDPASVAAFRFNAASTRAADLAPWRAGRITALGDAVHATPPTAGMGAGTAIRDAADLVQQLAGDNLLDAVAAYESGLRERGAEVLTLAMKTVRLILATDTPLGAAATSAVTPLLAAATRLRR
ncbi:FAD-dependent oxidoreductase [Kribbella italica]|uniref:2-polyprenyl-6-methoxyphenol hydroxylase-like FAD-dependent oxidoreductase n=1 Tax=Kribbella italica TaxID=1540520 RepID=A0A7W9JDT7_9ACTN|nr:FAD-dependent monooxygenase [Kribbella italica]MBB5840144.1 2-polyprenyl-6-methoxyphenol hydroxylase-like FAD-dependent oxidoreductase [Kribbella italica]